MTLSFLRFNIVIETSLPKTMWRSNRVSILSMRCVDVRTSSHWTPISSRRASSVITHTQSLHVLVFFYLLPNEFYVEINVTNVESNDGRTFRCINWPTNGVCLSSIREKFASRSARSTCDVTRRPWYTAHFVYFPRSANVSSII